MKNRLKAILILACIMAVCAVFVACSGKSEIDDYIERGYTVKVTYDGNYGTFVGGVDTRVIDMYNPSSFTVGEDGKVHISLVDPTTRKSNGIDISLTRSGHFIAGWYTERTVKTNEQGQPVDEDGVALVQTEGGYAYADGTTAVPDYTYGGLWDYSTDTIDYTLGSGLYEMTLYAGWVRYYEFRYYYLDNGEWTLVSDTTFDYKTSLQNNLKRETIWLPQYENGAMNYRHTYEANVPVTDEDGNVSYEKRTLTYTFPSIENTTFDKAYLDPEMTQEITSVEYAHHGTFDLATAAAVDRVQDIYFTAKQGNIFKIETAEQFVDNIDFTGIYEIYADLDFSEVGWPAAFVSTRFDGQITSMNGNAYKFKNVNIRYTSTDSNLGGAFGSLGQNAVVKDIVFENLSIDYVSCEQRIRDAKFGLFAGYIEDGATVENVKLTGELIMSLNGQLAIDSSSMDNEFNIRANGNADGVTRESAVVIRIYGRGSGTSYRYNFNPEQVVVDASDSLTLQFGSFTLDRASYDALIVESFGEEE